MELLFNPALVMGLMLSIMRVAGFVLSSPIFPVGIPVIGRVALTLGLGLFFAAPFPGSLDLLTMLGAAIVNLTVGLLLGWLTGLVFAIFPIAGGVIDVASGMGVAAILDPNQGIQAAVFNRLFTLLALAIFMLVGGDQLLIHGIALSIETIPLDGGISLQAGLAPFVVDAVTHMFVAGAEIALPVVAALFVTEVVLGIASRFAPAANVFILGLPLRILVAFGVVTVSLTMFPGAVSAAMRLMREAMVAGLRGLGVAG